MCIDLRALNANTKLCSIARIADLLDKLSKARCFGVIDLISAYY